MLPAFESLGNCHPMKNLMIAMFLVGISAIQAQAECDVEAKAIAGAKALLKESVVPTVGANFRTANMGANGKGPVTVIVVYAFESGEFDGIPADKGEMVAQFLIDKRACVIWPNYNSAKLQ